MTLFQQYVAACPTDTGLQEWPQLTFFFCFMYIQQSESFLDGQPLLGVWTYLQFDPKSLSTRKAKFQLAHLQNA